jgi:AraC family transcriptional regulator
MLFIQRNLDTELSLETLSAKAYFSAYHFHRIFKAFVGESIGEYVRRLKLERAAMKLINTDLSVTDISLEAGYDNHAALSRAFKKFFNSTPTDFRKNKKPLRASTSPFQQITSEVKYMKPEIRTIPDMTVIFVRKTGDYGKSSQNAWETICKFAYSRKLVGKDSKFIGISHDDPNITDSEKLRYDACITIDKPVNSEGEVGVQTIKGGKYAIFLHKGPYENFSETYKIIFAQWLPESNEKLRDEPCFELYLNRDPRRTKPENLRTEIYVPIENESD